MSQYEATSEIHMLRNSYFILSMVGNILLLHPRSGKTLCTVEGYQNCIKFKVTYTYVLSISFAEGHQRHFILRRRKLTKPLCDPSSWRFIHTLGEFFLYCRALHGNEQLPIICNDNLKLDQYSETCSPHIYLHLGTVRLMTWVAFPAWVGIGSLTRVQGSSFGYDYKIVCY